MRMLELENIIEQIKDKREEKAQLQQLLEDKVKQLKSALDSKTEQIDKDIYYLTQTARAEFEKLPSKVAKTQRKISLLSGEIVIKNATQKFDYDKSVLLEKGPADLVKTTEVKTFDWASYKKRLTVESGTVVDMETGEVVTEGVSIVEVPEEVVIK